MYAINMGLCAMNLAESAGEAINRETLAEIYVTQALCIKTCFPQRLHYAAVSCTLCLVEFGKKGMDFKYSMTEVIFETLRAHMHLI